MSDLEISVERDHLVDTTTYDAELNPIAGKTVPKPGYQLNGHRDDCRCPTCRPDIHWLAPNPNP